MGRRRPRRESIKPPAALAAELRTEREYQRARIIERRGEVTTRAAVFGILTVPQLTADVLGMPRSLASIQACRDLYRVLLKQQDRGLVTLEAYQPSHAILRPWGREWRLGTPTDAPVVSGDTVK